MKSRPARARRVSPASILELLGRPTFLPPHRANPVVSKNTNELKTGAPGRFDCHQPVASPRSGGREAMSAIRVPRTRRKNTVQQRDATLPDRDLDPGQGRTWTRTC